jgi:hypothetical protein
MQILIFVIIAAVYGLGSILKARSKKFEAEEGKEPSRPPKRPGPERAVRQGPRAVRQVRRPARGVPAGRAVPPTQKAPVRRMRPPQPVPEPLGEIELAPLEVPEELKVEVLGALGASEPSAALGFVLNLTDPAELKKAIVYSEIVGKPLSERHPPV